MRIVRVLSGIFLGIYLTCCCKCLALSDMPALGLLASSSRRSASVLLSIPTTERKKKKSHCGRSGNECCSIWIRLFADIFIYLYNLSHFFPFLLYFCDKDFHLKKYYICFIFIIIVKYNYIPFKTHHQLSFAMWITVFVCTQIWYFTGLLYLFVFWIFMSQISDVLMYLSQNTDPDLLSPLCGKNS